jgi:Spy/CpxP family protein refolding chaperone
MKTNHKKRALTFGNAMKRGIIITTLIGLVAATAARAADTNAPPLPNPSAHQPLVGNLLPPRVLEDLALTSGQQASYDALASDFKKDAAKWRADNNYDPEKAREEMSQARAASDQATIQKLTDQRKGLLDLRKSYVDKVRAFLTDEQKATLDKALEHAHDWSGGHGPSGALPPTQEPPADK